MGNDVAGTWRSRIALFTPCQIHHIRQLHAHTKPGTNQGTTISLFTLLICVITVTLISSAIYYETTNLHYVELHYATCNAFIHHSLFTTKNAFADSSPPCKLLPSLLLLCMDMLPNPGPTIQELTQGQNPQPPKLTDLPTSFTPQLNTPIMSLLTHPDVKGLVASTLKHDLLTRLMHLLTLHL